MQPNNINNVPWTRAKRFRFFSRFRTSCPLRMTMKILTCITITIVIVCFVYVLILYGPTITSLKRKRIRMFGIRPTTLKISSEHSLQGTPFTNIHLNEIYKDLNIKDNKDDSSDLLYDDSPADMIHTVGCSIPVAMIPYDKYLTTNSNSSCGTRAVFLSRTEENVKASMNKRMKELVDSKKAYCCYRFFRSSLREGHKLLYTKCHSFDNGNEIKLIADFIQIRCFIKSIYNKFEIIYEDFYAFTKKVTIVPKPTKTCKDRYNILMLGIDSMSLPRFVMTMKRTVNYFKENFWLSYRGNHKVAHGRFSNLLATLTGRNITTIRRRCYKRMDYCNDLLIWNAFKPLGYVTAYVEDYLELPNTFSRSYKFSSSPTHHYMKSFFLQERETKNKSLICTGQMPSAKQVLDYALDFALTYRRDNFFGLFWMNSFSHRHNSEPEGVDKIFEDFFNRLSYTGVLKNTFLILFSNNGIKFGPHKERIESYYDERMPLLFILSPDSFKTRHPMKYHALAVNQFRLVTHYDLYNTLRHIKSMAVCDDEPKYNNSTTRLNTTIKSSSSSCPFCQSLFYKVSPRRTCDDMNIEDNICGCHKVYPLDLKDPEGLKGIMMAVEKIKNLTQTVLTNKCWICTPLSLRSVVRIHFFYDTQNSRLHFLVAFTMSADTMSVNQNITFEAIIVKVDSELQVSGPVSVISAYNEWGRCVKYPKDRLLCVCQSVKC